MIRKPAMAAAMFVLLSACNGSGGGTPVPTTDAEKEKLASDIATKISDPKMFDGMFDSVRASMMPTLSEICSTVAADKQAECTDKMAAARPAIESSMEEAMAQAKEMMPSLMQDMGSVMARVYTGEELAKMNDFYTSPEGKSIMAKQPKVMAEFMPIAAERMKGMQLDMMRKTQERVAEALEGVAPAPN